MNKTILIVEDEGAIAELIQQLLEREGFSCHHCDNGSQAMNDLIRPFSPIEPVARVQDLLRRQFREGDSTQNDVAEQIHQTPHFVINLDQHTAHRQLAEVAEPLDLAALEFKLLSTFLS